MNLSWYDMQFGPEDLLYARGRIQIWRHPGEVLLKNERERLIQSLRENASVKRIGRDPYVDYVGEDWELLEVARSVKEISAVNKALTQIVEDQTRANTQLYTAQAVCDFIKESYFDLLRKMDYTSQKTAQNMAKTGIPKEVDAYFRVHSMDKSLHANEGKCLSELLTFAQDEVKSYELAKSSGMPLMPLQPQ